MFIGISTSPLYYLIILGELERLRTTENEMSVKGPGLTPVLMYFDVEYPPSDAFGCI